MLCRKPIVLHKYPDSYFLSKDPKTWIQGIPVPCGQCLMCRINKRRQWTTRLLLEAMAHEVSSFWTLTYSDENIPYTDLATLSYKDVQLFLKRLRNFKNFRFYCACEYGSKTFRPHYHIVLFGISPDDYSLVSRCWTGKTSHFLGTTFLTYDKRTVKPIIQTASALGNIYLGYDCSFEAMQYVAGYVTKKLSAKRLNKNDVNYRRFYKDGRERERAIMSRNPGIGIPTLLTISKRLKEEADKNGKFPTFLEIGKRKLPFDRTLLAYLAILFPEYFNPLDSAYRAKAEFDYLSSNPNLLSNVDADLLDRLGKVGSFRFIKDEQKAKNITSKLSIKGVLERET